MWPWGHAALGYLCYSVLLWALDDRPPGDLAALALGVGTQLPDLVDKTAAWYLNLLPAGRSLGHSLLVAVPLSLAVYWYARRSDHRRLGVAFAVGYLSHLLGDALLPLVELEWQYLTFLVWPALEAPPYETGQSVWAHLVALEPTPFFLFGLALTALALALWARDGYPGLGTLRERAAAVA